MLPIQIFLANKIASGKLTKQKIAKSLCPGLKQAECVAKMDEFFTANEPDYNIARKLAGVLDMTDEEFEELWYKTKDQLVRRKIRTRIYNRKTVIDSLQTAEIA